MNNPINTQQMFHSGYLFTIYCIGFELSDIISENVVV